MIISHSKKFIFIHNYKVAGTSVTNNLNIYDSRSFTSLNKIDKLKILLGLYPKIYSKQFNGHIKAVELRDRLPEYIFDQYYKFGFVRNPWDWQVSLYSYAISLPTLPQHKLIKSMKSFDDYIEWRVNNDLHLQKDFFYDGEQCLVNFIGKMENLNEDFKTICNRIGIKTSPLGNLNKSRKEGGSFINYYSQKSIDLVAEAFHPDISIFGYEKPRLG